MKMSNKNEDEVYEWSDLRPCPGDIFLLVGGKGGDKKKWHSRFYSPLTFLTKHISQIPFTVHVYSMLLQFYAYIVSTRNVNHICIYLTNRLIVKSHYLYHWQWTHKSSSIWHSSIKYIVTFPFLKKNRSMLFSINKILW